jgi:hypothetical protein
MTMPPMLRMYGSAVQMQSIPDEDSVMIRGREKVGVRGQNQRSEVGSRRVRVRKGLLDQAACACRCLQRPTLGGEVLSRLRRALSKAEAIVKFGEGRRRALPRNKRSIPCPP